ncbi:MAG: hypothetical protein OXM87_04030 [Truepera sp.]|nr:hypothetical protein [Truepera sp.]
MSPGEEVIGLEPARSALDELEIDTIGLEARDRAIFRSLSEKFAGGPVRAPTLATPVAEDRTTP